MFNKSQDGAVYRVSRSEKENPLNELSITVIALLGLTLLVDENWKSVEKKR